MKPTHNTSRSRIVGAHLVPGCINDRTRLLYAPAVLALLDELAGLHALSPCAAVSLSRGMNCEAEKLVNGSQRLLQTQ